jgi:hypothetical protein
LCRCPDQAHSLTSGVQRGHDVHQGSPNVEKGGVGASDSTLRGNSERGGEHG